MLLDIDDLNIDLLVCCMDVVICIGLLSDLILYVCFLGSYCLCVLVSFVYLVECGMLCSVEVLVGGGYLLLGFI